jgi:hypothetical protein
MRRLVLFLTALAAAALPVPTAVSGSSKSIAGSPERVQVSDRARSLSGLHTRESFGLVAANACVTIPFLLSDQAEYPDTRLWCGAWWAQAFGRGRPSNPALAMSPLGNPGSRHGTRPTAMWLAAPFA